MSASLIAPALFDIVLQYADDIKTGKVKLKSSIGSASPALVFCENFYAQFFQNKLGKQIKRINQSAKQEAVGFRLDAKQAGADVAVIRLITWFERLCDIYPVVLALGYGVGSKTQVAEFHRSYLLTLLKRIDEWSQIEKGWTPHATRERSDRQVDRRSGRGGHMSDGERKELLRILELDYEKTTKSIESVISTTFTIRGWGITLVSALIGFTFQTRRWEISALAAMTTLLVATIGYHSWLYAKLLQQAHNVERVLKLYYAALARGEDDPQATREFEVAILSHRFGRFAEVQRFQFRSVREIRPRVVFFGLYGTLLAAAALGFALVRIPEPTAVRYECKPVEGTGKVFVCQPK